MATIKFTKRLKRLFTENIFLKFLSLLISIILWIIVSGERNTEWSYLVPLDIVDQPQELIITNNFPSYLDVRLKGPQSFIKGLNPNDMAVQLNLSNLKKGSNILPITADLVHASRGATVIKINPSYINLDVEKLVRKKVVLKADIQGRPAKDFYVDSVEVIPDKIDIKGAESEAKRIRSLSTGTINVSGRKDNFQKEIAVETSGRKIIIDREVPVVVNVTIKEVSVKLSLKGIRPQVINSRHNSAFRPGKLNIMIEGPKSLIATIKEGNITAYVDASDLKPGNYRKEVSFKLPEGVRLIYSYPEKVKLTIIKKAATN